jgi:hypothetical protein
MERYYTTHARCPCGGIHWPSWYEFISDREVADQETNRQAFLCLPFPSWPTKYPSLPCQPLISGPSSGDEDQAKNLRDQSDSDDEDANPLWLALRRGNSNEDKYEDVDAGEHGVTETDPATDGTDADDELDCVNLKCDLCG